jgi:hypothetical protein
MAIVTDLYLNQTVGTAGTQAGNPVRLVLQAATSAIQIHAQLTSGAAVIAKDNSPILYYAVSAFDMAASVAMDQLKFASLQLLLYPSSQPSSTLVAISPTVPALGAYLFVWLSYPTLSPTASLNAKVAEL